MSDRKCVSCNHNIRINTDKGIKCRCDIDGHDIGYVECFEGWCRHWSKNKSMCEESEDGKQTYISGNEAR